MVNYVKQAFEEVKEFVESRYDNVNNSKTWCYLSLWWIRSYDYHFWKDIF